MSALMPELAFARSQIAPPATPKRFKCRPLPVVTVPSSVARGTPDRMLRSVVSGRDGGLEAEEIAEGAADHRGLLVVRNSHELLRDELAAAAKRALRVRVVVAPHDARHAGDVAARDRDRVVLERHVELALHVLARRERVGPLVVEAEELRDVRLVGGRTRVVPDPEPPVGVL